MAFSPENLKIWVDSREIHAFIQTATYPPFTKGTHRPRDPGAPNGDVDAELAEGRRQRDRDSPERAAGAPCSPWN